MQNLIKDFVTFIKSLSFIDILFILSLIGLVILIVSLIYIYKINDEDNVELIGDNNHNNEEEKTIENDEELDLVSISHAIEDSTTKPITLNDYEKEQEEKAIISYDELLKTKEIPLEEINYKSEENIDGLMVKSIDMDSPTKPIELPKIKEKYEKMLEEEKNKKTVLISYEKEEEFLETLKKLDKLLN